MIRRHKKQKLEEAVAEAEKKVLDGESDLSGSFEEEAVARNQVKGKISKRLAESYLSLIVHYFLT